MNSPQPKLISTLALVLSGILLMGAGGKGGLNKDAANELRDAGVDKYLGQFTPASTSDVGDGWTKHRFDFAGGGACWQDF